MLIHVHVDLWDLTMYVNTNPTHLLNELGFLNPNNDMFIKWVSCVNPFIRFYQSKQKQKKKMQILVLTQLILTMKNQTNRFFNIKLITNE